MPDARPDWRRTLMETLVIFADLLSAATLASTCAFFYTTTLIATAMIAILTRNPARRRAALDVLRILLRRRPSESRRN